jgi:hypothetical protein
LLRAAAAKERQQPLDLGRSGGRAQRTLGPYSPAGRRKP